MSGHGEHVAIISPDERGRFALVKFIAREFTRWRVFVAEDGRTVTLQAVTG